MVTCTWVRSGFIGELHIGVGGECWCWCCITCVVDALDVSFTIRVVFGVGDRNVVAFGVGDFVDSPASDNRTSSSFYAWISAFTIFNDLPCFGPYFKVVWAIGCCGGVADDLGEVGLFCSVFGIITPVDATCGDEALTIDTEFVIGVVVDTADRTVLDDGFRAARDLWQPI